MHTYIHRSTCVHKQYTRIKYYNIGSVVELRQKKAAKERKNKTFSVKDDIFTNVVVNIWFDDGNSIEDVFTA